MAAPVQVAHLTQPVDLVRLELGEAAGVQGEVLGFLQQPEDVVRREAAPLLLLLQPADQPLRPALWDRQVAGAERRLLRA